jgi:hypothetical protein
MTFSIHCENIDELIQKAISWAQSESSGIFSGTSAEGGMLRLVAWEFIPVDGVFYSAIELRNIKIPERRRRQGLYTMLLKGLDSLDKFGVRLHNTTENDWLIEHHRRHGYSEDKFGGNSPSFSLIIGTPLDVEKQRQLQHIFPSKTFSRRKPGSGGLIPRNC